MLYTPALIEFFYVFNFLFFRQARSCDRMQSHKSGTESSSQSSLCQMQTFLNFPNPLTWSMKPQIIQVNWLFNFSMLYLERTIFHFTSGSLVFLPHASQWLKSRLSTRLIWFQQICLQFHLSLSFETLIKFTIRVGSGFTNIITNIPINKEKYYCFKQLIHNIIEKV